MQATVRAQRTRTTAPRTVPMKQMRFWIICLFFLFWAGAITARLFWLQVVRHSDYVERAQKQQQRTFEVAPRRGILYDRNIARARHDGAGRFNLCRTNRDRRQKKS